MATMIDRHEGGNRCAAPAPDAGYSTVRLGAQPDPNARMDSVVRGRGTDDFLIRLLDILGSLVTLALSLPVVILSAVLISAKDVIAGIDRHHKGGDHTLSRQDGAPWSRSICAALSSSALTRHERGQRRVISPLIWTAGGCCRHLETL